MTTLTKLHGAASRSVSPLVASEVRAEMGRQGISQRELARRMEVSQVWLSRRVGINADVDIRLEDVAAMAEALDVSVERLLSAWLPRLDSNQEPSGYRLSVVSAPAPVADLGAWRERRAS